MPPLNDSLSPMTRQYIKTALWSSTDDSGDEPLDKSYGIEDIHPDTLAQMVADCRKFQEDHAKLIFDALGVMIFRALPFRSIKSLSDIGHDFWLTRNGHGAGFWDGDWPEPYGQQLTDAAHAFGEYNLYVGDNGKIYGMNG